MWPPRMLQLRPWAWRACVRFVHDVRIPPAVRTRMSSLLSRHSALTTELEAGSESMTPAIYATKAKELASLQNLAALSFQWKTAETKIEDAQRMLKECDEKSADGLEMIELCKTCCMHRPFTCSAH